MPIGAKILGAIDDAIKLRDKLLLILSEHSIARALAARGVATMHGGSWTPAQVAALLDRPPPS